MRFKIINDRNENTNCNLLDISVEYDKGFDAVVGMERPRGYYVRITPMLKEPKTHDGVTYNLMSYGFSCARYCFEKVNRLNRKQLQMYQTDFFIKQLIDSLKLKTWAVNHGYDVAWDL